MLYGSYEQDNDLTDGSEPIEWLVLDKKDGRLLVISRYALDYRPYHDNNESATWENCTLRKWLNDGFLKKAFNDDERKMIPTVMIREDVISGLRNYQPSNETQDKLFLLSVNEAKTLFRSDSVRKCEPTVYAESKGCPVYNGFCWWLLRPCYHSRPGTVNRTGNIDSMTSFSDADSTNRTVDMNGIRPAMWINIG